MGFWKKWTKKKVKELDKENRNQEQYIKRLEKQLKKKKA